MYFNYNLWREYTAFYDSFDGETNFADIMEKLRVHVDTQCSKKMEPPRRIYDV
jgi:hypothetical protein